MQAPLEISFKNMEPSPAAAADIRARAEKLDRYFDSITSCHVAVEAPHRHHRHGRQWHVRIVLNLPGRQLAVSNDPGRDEKHEELSVALRDSFDAARRRLQDYARELHGDVKSHEPPQREGRVLRVFAEQGYGFIDAGEEGEVYFHRNSVLGDAFAALVPGSRVAFVLARDESEHGVQASTVRPLE
jgi:cold shock CspA family protein/ribosome-associated translation inhibitor RaiA